MRHQRFSKPLVVALVLVVLVSSCRSSSPDTVSDAPESVPTAPSTGVSTAESAKPSTTDATSPSSAVDQSRLAPGDHVFELRHDGRDRSYIVHVPETAPALVPAVVALHGGGGTGADFQAQNGLDVVADREGFIAVYPEGSGLLPNRLHTWNSGDTCCGFAMDRDIDDVGFLRAMIEDLTVRTPLDRGRIYMTGHSNGSMMAYRVAAEAADLVTAIVPVGGALDLADIAPSTPVPVLHIHSVDDPRAVYEGGDGPPFPGTNRTVNHEPVMPTIARWASSNGCEGEPTTVSVVEGTGSDEGHTAERLVWQGCPDGADVEHLRLSGTGHGWPGVEVARFVQEILGPSTTVIDASEEVWAFASQFER